jgi:hypothetical protein
MRDSNADYATNSLKKTVTRKQNRINIITIKDSKRASLPF